MKPSISNSIVMDSKGNEKYSEDRAIVQSALKGDDAPLANYLLKRCSYAFSKAQKLYADNNIYVSKSDLINDTYILLRNNKWQKLRTYTFKSQLHSWLKTVVHFYFLNKLKKELKEKDGISSLVYETKKQETMFEEKELDRQKLEIAIDQLSSSKEKLVLRYMLQNYHDEAIAARMGISTGNVHVIRCRAQKHLIRLLNDKK